jgi:hypothetical protein
MDLRSTAHGEQALLEEAVEASNDTTRVHHEHFERVHHGVVLEPSFAKGYVERELCLHVHGSFPEAEPRYWCAVYEWSGQRLNVVDVPLIVGRVPRVSEHGAYEVEAAVLIDDVQVVDHPEGVEVGISTVRLQPLHLCEHFPIDPGELPFALLCPSLRSAALLEDRELRILSGGAIDTDKRIRRMVEGASESVDAFTCERTPTFQRRRLDNLRPPDVVARFRVHFAEHSVRVALLDEAVVLGAKLAEVLLCPLNLRSRTSELGGV